MARVTELVFRGNNRSAVRALEGIATSSQTTTRTLKKDSDESAASLGKVRKESSALRDTMGGLMGLVGIGGVAFGLKDLRDSAVALQSNQAQLQTALKATGQTAGGTATQLQKFAESLSTKGGFGTTENLQALTAYVRETHSATQAQSMLTLATNIARGRNLDLATAQNVVAKAYTGSVGKLQALLGPMVASREATVGLTVAHQKQIATLQNEASMMGKMGSHWLRGQEIALHLTAQQSALAQMTDKHATAQRVLALATQEFAGATDTYSRQTAGHASNTANAFHNLTEQLGLGLLPTMDKIIGAAAKVAEWMAKNKKTVMDVALAVAGLTVAWGGLKILEGIKTMALDLGKALGLAGAEGAAGAEAATFAWGTFMRTTIIGLAVFGLIELVAHWKQVEGVVIGVVHTIERIFPKVFDAITYPFRKAFDFIKGGIHSVSHAIGGIGNFLERPFGIALSGGGQVPKYMAAGGPMGTDTVPAWLTPGEGVLSRQGMAAIGGENALSAINAGQMAGGMGGASRISIYPSTTELRVDGRELGRAVVRWAQNAAARGPSSYSGGSIVTGAAGLPA